MNERIKEIAEQVWGDTSGKPWSASAIAHLEHFAELVRQDEREKCAKLCDDASLYFIDQGMNAVDGADYCANEIRGRTEPKSDFKNQMDDNWSGII
jgi:hypothetical protein